METMNDTILERLKAKFLDINFEATEFRGELTLIIPKERMVEVCKFLKVDSELQFDFLADLCGIDMMTPSKRFGVIYNLYSLAHNYRMRLKTFTEEEHPIIPSVTGIWRTANWHERETFDMFGLIFDGHPDLRRIYMPDEFEYYPLRKDFPLMGIRGSLELQKK